jgi:hypothetical protein
MERNVLAAAAAAVLLTAGSASAQVQTIKACGQTVTYTLTPPGAGPPESLKGYMGVWQGTRDNVCAGVVFECVDDPNAVQMVVFNGNPPANNPMTRKMEAQATRLVGKFDGGQIVTSSANGKAHYTFILDSDQQLTSKVYGEQLRQGKFKRQ